MSRIPACACYGCSSVGTVKVDSFRRGGRSIFMCDFHANHRESYNFENDNRLGSVKANGITVGQEFETSYSSEKARAEILQNGYVPTIDCTVDVEYKSPIFEGLNAISKQALTLERLMQSGDLVVGEECGTHTHIGHHEYINATTIDYLRRFYHSLFVPLSDAMSANPEAVRRVFGRGFNHWATPVDRDTYAENHTNFINLQHTYSIEFRLVKFENAQQYMHAVKFCKAVAEAVINNFIVHFNDTDFDRSRYDGYKAYRLHKAQVTANKLVKIWEKYSA